MPVQKYRSVADMPRPPVADPAHLAERIRAVWNRAFAICAPVVPRGVTLFSSIEAANEERMRATLARMRKTKER